MAGGGAGQPDDRTESAKFLAFLQNDRNIFQGYSQSSEDKYVPRSILSRYFANGPGSIEDLLREVLKDEEHVPQAEAILQQYLVIFSILLSIGKGQYLARCVERDYSDDRLPFFDRPRHFPKSESGSFFDAFFDAQWRFCPAKITKNPVNFQLETEQILPLKRREHIASTAASTTYLVEFHEEYDSLGDDSSIFEIDLGIGKPASHTYLFKEFAKVHKSAYDKELTAFLYLQKAGQLIGKSITGFYGSFEHNDTHTIILEHADRGTLNLYMATTLPPTSAEDITRVWESILKLQEGLHMMHNISAPYSADVTQHTLLRGWHQSLSTENIFVVGGETESDYDCQFRIANIGTPDEVERAKLYAAPESLNAQSDTNMQMADVFSMGCILSEFAVWITSGLSGLNDYRADRKQEAEDRGTQHLSSFHDGHNLLESVTCWNHIAVDNTTGEDGITEAIMHQAVEEMLCEDGDARPTTRQLKLKVNKILARAREQHLSDLRRQDSTASTSTGYSSVALSSRSRPSFRNSMASNSSGEASTANGANNLGQLGRSATARSTNSTWMSPSVIEEDKEVFFGSTQSPRMTSPVSPASRPQLQAPSRLGPNLNGSDAPEAVGLHNSNHVARVSPAYMSAALLNGDDKEIVVTRGPPPTRSMVTSITPVTTAREGTMMPQPALVVVTPREEPQATVDTSHAASAGNGAPSDDTPAYTPIEIRPDHDLDGAGNLPVYTPLDIRPDHDPQAAHPPALASADLSRSQTTASRVTTSSQDEGRSGDDLRRSLTSPGGPRPINVRSVSNQEVYKPQLDLIDGLLWLNKKKGSASGGGLPGEACLTQLGDRDFMFLIDDSGSMQAHREMSSRCVRLMAWLLKKHDKNGMDLYFMNKPGKTHTRPGHSSDLQRPILKTLDEARGMSNINTRLSQILSEYRDRNAVGSGSQTSSRMSIASIGSSSRTITSAKKLMVYVISDGNWEAGTEGQLANTIDAIGTALKAQGAPDKAMGIQWIRTTERNKERFEKLTVGRRDMDSKILMDTVDLESNVFRSLLGPIVDLWDDTDTA